MSLATSSPNNIRVVAANGLAIYLDGATNQIAVRDVYGVTENLADLLPGGGLSGPKGQKGATGAQGPQGDAGSTGPQGAVGPQGSGVKGRSEERRVGKEC